MPLLPSACSTVVGKSDFRTASPPESHVTYKTPRWTFSYLKYTVIEGKNGVKLSLIGWLEVSDLLNTPIRGSPVGGEERHPGVAIVMRWLFSIHPWQEKMSFLFLKFGELG